MHNSEHCHKNNTRFGTHCSENHYLSADSFGSYQQPGVQPYVYAEQEVRDIGRVAHGRDEQSIPRVWCDEIHLVWAPSQEPQSNRCHTVLSPHCSEDPYPSTEQWLGEMGGTEINKAKDKTGRKMAPCYWLLSTTIPFILSSLHSYVRIVFYKKPATCCHSLAPLSHSQSPKIAWPVVIVYYD